MATLPQGADLRKGGAPNASSIATARAPDYGPQAAGARAIQAGGEAMGRAAQDYGRGLGSFGRDLTKIGAEIDAKADEVDDYETRKRLMDFKLASEMELEELKREMPVGGAGYTQSWLEMYKSRAADFVGEKDANIPASQRAKIGLALKAHEVALAERAQRDENAERDRYTIDGLETTVQAHRSRVEADPTRIGEVQGEVGKLIDLAPLTPAQRHVYARKVREGISEAAALSYADRATSAQGLEDAKRILAPHAPDRGGSAPGSYVEEIKKLEGYTPQAKWDYRQNSNGYGTKARFAGEVIDKAEAEKRLDTELAQAATIVDRFKPDLAPGTRAALISLTFNAGDDWTRGGLGSAIKAGDLPKARELFRQYNQAGGEVLPGLVSRRNREASWIGRMDGGDPAPGSEEAYAGPLADLPLAKRRAIWAKAEGTFNKARTETAKEITAYEANAAMGILPPAEILETIKRKVEAVNDPMVTAQFNSTFRFAQEAAYLNKLPPQAIEQIVNETSTKLGDRMTPEQGKRLEQVRKLEANVRTQVNADPMTYAHKVGLEVPIVTQDGKPAAGSARAGQEEGIPQQVTLQKVQLQPLDFNAPDIDERIRQRGETARNVGAYYQQPAQYFTKIERDALKDTLAKGGTAMLYTLGKLQNGLGSDGLLQAMKEVSADRAPEVTMVGRLMATGGNADAINDAAQGLKLRSQEGFISHVDQKMRAPEVQIASQVLARTPGMVDPVTRLADTIYETRHRTKGFKEFDVAEYRKIVNEVMGETTVGDVKFGGVGYQGTGWSDGKWSTAVQVPPSVRQDKFDAVVNLLTPGDVAISGTPLYGDGKPMKLGDVKRSTFVTVGVGKYLLQTGTDEVGAPTFALDQKGAPFVLDMQSVVPSLKQRKPEFFK